MLSNYKMYTWMHIWKDTKRKRNMSNRGIEPRSSQPQCEILTTVRI